MAARTDTECDVYNYTLTKRGWFASIGLNSLDTTSMTYCYSYSKLLQKALFPKHPSVGF